MSRHQDKSILILKNEFEKHKAPWALNSIPYFAINSAHIDQCSLTKGI